MMVQRPHLEPIQEESEQEDEIEGSKTGEEEDLRVGVEAKEVMTADESEEDDDLLRVLRPRRIYRSHSQVSFPQVRPTIKRQRETDSSVSEQSSHSVDLKGEETLQPVQARLGNEKRSVSDELRIKEPFPEWLVDLMFNIEEATTHQLLVE
ncbi:hypothetical protein GBF38_016533 [Nibea albiflora]|uniref:Uncharacterized protein n=1 Tax=Nibea albiflora TaxID=240163 RepID=A0ACB7FIS9_NIBAL|nr:hypothetical protein GBF38_016533 [Nibea albiflora]